MATMPECRSLLLTGATGLLGRYLLRDLLASGHRLGVLVRDSKTESASDRLAELHAFACDTLRRQLPNPIVLHGDLTAPRLGLGAAERNWLAREADAVIHSAAQVSYRPTPTGEPWETNVNGTRRLLELCRTAGVAEVHHLSTAFVCGDRRGLVLEDELDRGGGSTNAYEQSKFASEQLIRQFAGIRATIYRPSVVVGDSRSGYTSTYHHFYRFLELAVRLSSRPANNGSESKPRRQQLPLRLPLTGEETQNLVPVDWVSKAIIELVHRPQHHGRIYHLVAWQPVRLQTLKAIIEDLLQIEGLRWVGRDGLPDPTSLEQLVLEQLQDYWSYLHGDLVFDCRNTRRALADLPPPAFDRALVLRLLRFAQDDKWGRGRRARPARSLDLSHYLECVLPEQVSQSQVARALPCGLRFALVIQGPGGGQWSYTCGDRMLLVQRGFVPGVSLTYRLDVPTFAGLVQGRLSARQGFFDGRIEIEGDMEKALLLALLIEQFFTERADRPEQQKEMPNVVAGRT
jgi:thioester reductase-like protein